MLPALAAPAAPTAELTGLAGLVVDVVDALGAVGVGVLVAAENVFPPVPSEVVLPLGGYLAAQGRMSYAAVLVAATLGSVVGALLLYLAGARLGRARVRRLVDRLPLVDVADLERAESWFARHGQAAVLLGRMIPVVRSLISVPAGVEGMPLPRFLLLTALGSGAWNALFITLGFQVGERWTSIGQYSDVLNGVVLAALLALVLLAVVRRWRARA